MKDGFSSQGMSRMCSNPAVEAGIEAQAALFARSRMRECPALPGGGEGEVAGPDWGAPQPCGFVVQNQPEPPHVPRGSAPGRGWDVQCE